MKRTIFKYGAGERISSVIYISRYTIDEKSFRIGKDTLPLTLQHLCQYIYINEADYAIF